MAQGTAPSGVSDKDTNLHFLIVVVVVLFFEARSHCWSVWNLLCSPGCPQIHRDLNISMLGLKECATKPQHLLSIPSWRLPQVALLSTGGNYDHSAPREKASLLLRETMMGDWVIVPKSHREARESSSGLTPVWEAISNPGLWNPGDS